MNSELRFTDADRPLLTMGDVTRWKDQLRTLQERKQSLLNSIAALDQEIAAVEGKVNFAESIAAERGQSVHERGHHFAGGDAEPDFVIRSDNPPQTIMGQIKRPGRKLKNADAYMRDLAARMLTQDPRGFSVSEFATAYANDESIPAEERTCHRTYIYRCLKRLRDENILDVTAEGFHIRANPSGAPQDATTSGPSPEAEAERINVNIAPIDGYKLVPLSKEEKVREECRRYLSHRKANTAHRTQIADRLVEIGLLGTEKSVVGTIAVYMAKWPEFSADGSGNYTLDRSKIPPNDPFASS